MFKGELDKRSVSGFSKIEWFSNECHKTKTKPITYQLDYSANLKLE